MMEQVVPFLVRRVSLFGCLVFCDGRSDCSVEGGKRKKNEDLSV